MNFHLSGLVIAASLCSVIDADVVLEQLVNTILLAVM